MNLMYLSLYLIAAFIIGFVLVRTILEKEKISRRVATALLLCLVCVIAYSVNFMTDNYRILTIATSLMMIAQDFALIAVYRYTTFFTRIRNRVTKTVTAIFIVFGLADAVVFVINIFNEFALQFSMNMCDGVYVLGYEGNTWFAIHVIINICFLAGIVSLLVIKCMRIPKAYWGRYVFMGAGLFIIAAIKYIFISKTFDLRFDISIFLYAFLGALIYWNTFWYSKKNMLTVTHAMIIDHMQVPVVLFDYEGVLADYNTAMKEIFEDLEYDNRDQTFEWFVKSKNVPIPEGNIRSLIELGAFEKAAKKLSEGESETFSWDLDGRNYNCSLISLIDEKKRVLGQIVVMQDVTELQTAYKDLENTIIYDKLTGLYSKFSFLEHCREYDDFSKTITVVVSNINGLARINLEFGQREGDTVVVKLSEVIKRELGDKAYLAKINDSIVAVFEGINEAKAAALFDRIKTLVAKECSTKKYNVSIEYGIASRTKENAWMMDVVHQAESAMKNKKMLSNNSSSKSLINALTQSLVEKDFETEQKMKRTRILAQKLADELKLSDIQKAQLGLLVSLHDIGEIAIPHSILGKPGNLTKEERDIMITHTEKGYRIASAAEELSPIADSILSHHEYYDGTGYPNGIKGEAIPLLARILAVVDAYDSMTNDRPYHKAVSSDVAINELHKCAGSQFDPAIVEAFVSMMKNQNRRK